MQTTNIKKYNNYKDSGIEWIGEIPKNWNVKKIKYCCNTYTGNSINDNEKELYTDKDKNSIPYIATKDIKIETNEINYENGLYIPLDNKTFNIAPQNSILLCIEGGSAGRKIGYLEQDVCFVNKLCCFSYNKFNNSKLLYYILQSDIFLTDFNLKLTGLIGGVSQSAIKNIIIAIPKLEEQQQIADYLDKKCGEIDNVVETQKNIIEKLKEYKQSVITETVTKGLNKSVPQKDSGIEWIGNIPEHWEVQKLKYTTQIMRGKFNHRPRNDPKYYDGKFPFIQTGDITNASKYILTFSQTLNELGYSVSKEFPTGSICMTIAANIGDVAILNFNACFPDSIVGFVPTEQIHWNFLYYTLYAMKQQFTCNAIISTQLNLNVEIIKEILIPVPSLKEQQSLANYLDKKCSEIDTAISEKEQLIEKLTEYKKSLIYECVTGKRKVY